MQPLKTVRLQTKHFFDRRGGHPFVVDGRIRRSIGIAVATEPSHSSGVFFGRHVLRTAKHHVLNKVSDATPVSRFVTDTGLDPESHGCYR